MAAHYSAHPAIIGWQIDNEVNCETNSYHAPSDHEAFRKYLKEKYGTLENLNRAMGTTFWNQTYTDWEQVHLSRYTLANSNNPHMMLEEKRFISEAAINYIGIQADIIRKYRRSEQFITTNGLFGVLDNHKLVKEKLDFMTYDSYPNFAFAMEGSKLSPRSLRDRETSFNLAKTRRRLKPIRHHGAAIRPRRLEHPPSAARAEAGSVKTVDFPVYRARCRFCQLLPLAYLHIRHRNVLARIIEL